VVDSLNYGGLADPWAAKGYQGRSPGGGCSVPSPAAGGFGRGQAPAGPRPLLSAGRTEDGVDTDSNCSDFAVQTYVSASRAAAMGDTNVKVDSVAGLDVGQSVTLDVGSNRETATIASIGTPGGTEVRDAASAGAKEISVAGVAGFTVGETVTIDVGANHETATIASITRPRGFGAAAGGSITVEAPLAKKHEAGAPVSGTGVTFDHPLIKAHAPGTSLQNYVPTPGAPNRYGRRR
jgi:hypothetical protein